MCVRVQGPPLLQNTAQGGHELIDLLSALGIAGGLLHTVLQVRGQNFLVGAVAMSCWDMSMQ